MLEGLRKAREDAEMSREQVCLALGVHYNTLKNWELGTTEPKPTELVVLAEMYGCGVEALLGLPDAPAESAKAS